MAQAVTNALSIDVEDYFQVSAFAHCIPRSEWDSLPCRVERNMDAILAMLDEADVKATFFTLGWIAERYPGIVRDIMANGHELASHGYGHERASELDRDAFRQDVDRAKKILEDQSGQAVLGYRAPSFSIGDGNRWAIDVLEETGHRYSSSIFPVRHDHYGVPDAPRHPWQPNGEGGLWELPPTTVPMFGRNLPAAGGGWFRLLPYGVSRWMIRQVNDRERAACMFYFHPWELDPDQPRQRGVGLKSRFRHYVNLQHMPGKLRQLLNDFAWDRVDRVFLNH